MAKEKDKRFFGKMLNFIGLEETNDEEQPNRYDDEDPYEESYDEPYGDTYSEPETAFSRGGKASRKPAKEAPKPREDFRRQREVVHEVPQDNRGNVVGFNAGSAGSAAGAGGNKMKMIVYQPMTYDDTQNIIDNLKNRKPIIVNLESLETDVAQRILDFMSGAVYSLDGNIHKISKGIFILAPANVDITGNLPDELASKSFYTLGNRPKREY